MSNKSILERKSKYLNSMRVFPFFISFFCWNETTTKSSTKEDRRKMENCKADNIAEKLFRTYWKWRNLSLCKKHLYWGQNILISNTKSTSVTVTHFFVWNTRTNSMTHTLQNCDCYARDSFAWMFIIHLIYFSCLYFCYRFW